VVSAAHLKRFALIDPQGRPVPFALVHLAGLPPLCGDSQGRAQVAVSGGLATGDSEPQAAVVEPWSAVVLYLPELAARVTGVGASGFGALLHSPHPAGWLGDVMLVRWASGLSGVQFAFRDLSTLTLTKKLIDARARAVGGILVYACDEHSARRMVVRALGVDRQPVGEGAWIWTSDVGDAETGGIWLDMQRPPRHELDGATGRLFAVARAEERCLLAHPLHLVSQVEIPSGEAAVELQLVPGAPLFIALPGQIAADAMLEVTLTRARAPYGFVVARASALAPDGKTARLPFALPPGRFSLAVKSGPTVWRAELEVQGTLPVEARVR
jgi:hypothetical protein